MPWSPECRHRREPRHRAAALCFSPKLSGSRLVTPEVCAGCYCRDHPLDSPGEDSPVAADTPLARMRELIAGPPRSWPAGWADWPVTNQAHRDAADDFLDALPPYPAEEFHDRGVVIAGGGPRFFPALYITVRALRHVGCRLPVQVWYLGRDDEMPNSHRELLEPLGVECVDADAVRAAHPCRILNGWELKAYAVLHSPFAEVLSLDADCYPAENPSFLFEEPDYRERGAIFWHDEPFDARLNWSAFGVAPTRRPSIESGQFVVNKELCWRPLNLAWWYNDHSDWAYLHMYGDKHTFEVAWAKCGHDYAEFAERPQWAIHSFLHAGPDGRSLFIHRCRDKFRFANAAYLSPQNFDANFYHPDLPLENECFAWLAELAPRLGHSLDVLNLGCGHKPLAGAHNHDCARHHSWVNSASDLNAFPWPWPDAAFGGIVADDVLEHQGDVVAFMDECHRVLKPDGRLRLRVPHWQSESAWIDPTHRRGYHPRSFEFFTNEGYGRHCVYSDRRWEQLGQHEECLPGGPNLVFVLRPLK